MQYFYRTKGTCSAEITFEIEDNKLHNVKFMGGCDGNLKAIASLTEGMDVDAIIGKLQGIKCGSKLTSCGDQLANALIEAKTTRA